jgi:predicted metal-binding protein
VICFRTPLDQFKPVTVEESYRIAFKKVSGLLAQELLIYRRVGNIIAGSGACQACSQCAIEFGDAICRNPAKKIYSLESLGVNVIALSGKAFNIKLEWSGDKHAASYVSALGAVFL